MDLCISAESNLDKYPGIHKHLIAKRDIKSLTQKQQDNMLSEWRRH